MAPHEEEVTGIGAAAPYSLQKMRGSSREEMLAQVDAQTTSRKYRGLDVSMLGCELDAQLIERSLGFLAACDKGDVLENRNGLTLRLAHNDLGSGTDCEQRILELLNERAFQEREKAGFQKKKSESSKQKDFSISAKLRREGEEGIATTTARLAAIDEMLEEQYRRKEKAPWYTLFSSLEASKCNVITHLDLADCGLHATSIEMLTKVLLELEQRGDGQRVSDLVLDGNDLGDVAMGKLATYIKLSSSLHCLRLKNVGITDQGFSEISAGTVTNRSLQLLDLRNNGLCTRSVCKEVLTGIHRFNAKVEIMFV